MSDLRLTVAKWYLGCLDSARMPEFAQEALANGADGKNLAQLAGLVEPTKRDVQGLVDGVFRELGVAAPLSKDEAALWILDFVKEQARSTEITAGTLVGKLLIALPELEGPYLEEAKSPAGLPSNYWVFGLILKPAIAAQIPNGPTDFLRRSCSFFEQVCSSTDHEAINVLWIEVFEWLAHSKSGELKSLWPILGRSTKEVIREVARRRRETENLPS